WHRFGKAKVVNTATGAHYYKQENIERYAHGNFL
ncbi:MAG: hypothetical protein ACI89U_003320, partial [Gammaproteobacteria bacterium]